MSEQASVKQSILRTVSLGFVTYLSLGMYPYFPKTIAIAIAMLVTFVGYKSIRSAISLALIAFCISLAYQSYPLCILCAVIMGLLGLYTINRSSFPELFLIVAGAPCLAILSFNNIVFPLEFLIILIAAMVLKKEQAALAGGIACFWCVLFGVINQHEFVGGLIIGKVRFIFYGIEAAPSAFYNLSWVTDNLIDFPVEQLFGIASDLGTHILSRPLIFLQIVVWAALSYVVGFIFEKDNRGLDFLGGIVAIVGVIFNQLLVVALYKNMEFDFITFSLAVTVAMIVVVIFYEASKIIDTLPKPSLGINKLKSPTENVKASKPHFSPTPVASRKDEGIKEYIKSQRPSLEDSLRMQKHIGEYINQKFIHEVTALAVDVVGSVTLKSGESQESTIMAFTEYWRFVDDVMWRKQGRLLNRAGDGAVYVFNYADPCVLAAKDLLRGLKRFNSKINPLNSDFQVRIGLNTGKIVEDNFKSGSDVFSSVLDIAAHLEEAAPPGGVFVTAATYNKLSKTKKEFTFFGHSDRDDVDIYSLI
ncbi:MAG: adenylate/guanylate cyclase domain-containing protein [Candidatus Omnitrophica bacterium]|nr:adenylate/guanylate cyclase domain-containing protein [Candidatus Omnitrophota bacterium]